MTLGGRAAEEIFFGKISTGASNDLQQITRTAYGMVTVYGMNEKVGNVSYYDPNSDQTFTKPYSEETGKMIDEEVRKIISLAYKRTLALLAEKREQVEKLAKALLDKEVLFQSDVEELIGKRPFEVKSPVHVVDDIVTTHLHPAEAIKPAEEPGQQNGHPQPAEVAHAADAEPPRTPAAEEEKTYLK
jgi:AFG3 family protein